MPEYVKLVTRAYRQALTAIADGSYDEAFVDQLITDLKKVYNRGHSSGYYLGREQGWSRAYGSKATHQKILRGEVTHYYSKIGVAEIRAIGELKAGDEYVIIGETSGVVEGVAESLRLDDGEVPTVKSGDILAIKVPQRVRRNDKFFIMAPVAAT